MGLGPVGGDAGRQGLRVAPFVDGLDLIFCLTVVELGRYLIDLFTEKTGHGVPPDNFRFGQGGRREGEKKCR